MSSAPTAGPHVAVVGAGLVGLFVAHELLARGCGVTLLDAAEPGSGAARVNGGWVCPARCDPMPSGPVVRDGLHSLVNRGGGSFHLLPGAFPGVLGFLLRFVGHAGRARSARSWAELDLLSREVHGLYGCLEDDGIVTGLSPDDGFLVLHGSRVAADASRAAHQLIARRGLSPEPDRVLDRRALLDLEPGLGPAAQWGFTHRGDRWLDPSGLVDALIRWAREAGAHTVGGARVTSVRQRGRSVHLDWGGGQLEADLAVVAAGAWSEPLLRTLGLRGYVTPGKGYSFTVFPHHPLRHVLRLGDTHVGVTPMGTSGTAGRARIVGMVEMDGTHDRHRPSRPAQMRALARPWLDGVDWSATAHERTAPRPLTPDGKPLIGRVPGHERIVVATGHNMLGLTLAPPTARLVGHLVAPDARDPDPSAALRAFDPARFTARARGADWDCTRGPGVNRLAP